MPRSFRGYTIKNRINSGGMSTLFLGVQTALNREVAIKILYPALAADASFISRFEREARVASSLGHRNIVTVFDFGSENDTYFIVMEFVRGVDLRVLLELQPRFPVEIALTILEEIGYGLEATHARGIIHRDIKPANILLSYQGEVKIADFGLARLDEDRTPSRQLTLPGYVMGTAAYMSPEQASGGDADIDHRTDIFSLGAVAYELLTGERAFPGRTTSECIEFVRTRAVPRIRSTCPAIHPKVDALVSRMLEKKPEDRFQSVTDLLREIEGAMESLEGSEQIIRHRRQFLKRFAEGPKGVVQEMEERTSGQTTSATTAAGPPPPKAPARERTPVAPTVSTRDRDPGNGPARRAPHETTTQEPTLAGPADATLVEDRRVVPSRKWLIPVVGIGVGLLAVTGGWLALQPGTGALKVQSRPAGAAISLRAAGETDFKPSGLRTDCRLDGLKSGNYEIQIELAGYEKTSQPVGVSKGRETVVSATLVPLPPRVGYLVVRSTPASADVSVRRAGETAYTPTGRKTECRLELEPGDWLVRVEAAGTTPVESGVRIRSGDTVPLDVTLPRVEEPRRLIVSSRPAGATVEVRSGTAGAYRAAGTTPCTIPGLAPGRVQVRLKRDGYETETRAPTLDAPETRLDVTLRPVSPETGYFLVIAKPYADIYLDDELRYRSHRGGGVLAASAGSPHTIRLEHPRLGRHTWSGQSVAGGDTLTLEYEFK